MIEQIKKIYNENKDRNIENKIVENHNNKFKEKIELEYKWMLEDIKCYAEMGKSEHTFTIKKRHFIHLKEKFIQDGFAIGTNNNISDPFVDVLKEMTISWSTYENS